jgi:hypothetical protein
LWKQETFHFRVVGPDRQVIITDQDMRFRVLPDLPYTPEDDSSGEAFLLPDGVDKLDGYMARHANDTVTIEIAGESPIRRQITGRLQREPGMNAVFLRGLPTAAQVTTQPVESPH